MLYVFFCFPVQSVNPFPVFCTSHFLGKSWFMSCHSIVVEHSCFYLMLLWQLEVWFSLYCTRRGYKTLKAVYINISYQFKNCFFSICKNTVINISRLLQFGPDRVFCLHKSTVADLTCGPASSSASALRQQPWTSSSVGQLELCTSCLCLGQCLLLGSTCLKNSLPSLLSLVPTDVSKGECKALSLHCEKQPISRLLQKKGGSGREGSGDNGGEAFPYSQEYSVSFCFQWIFSLWIKCRAVGYCLLCSLSKWLCYDRVCHDFSVKNWKRKWEVAAHCSVA